MTAGWVDISLPLRSGMPNWPDDPPVRITRLHDLARGEACTVSHLDMTVHTGTHVDAPAHYAAGGATLDDMPLDATVGPARVVAIRDPAAIRPVELASLGLVRGERVLFRTANSERRWAERPFDDGYVALSLAAARELARIGVRTVGIDALSVGTRRDGDDTHRVLLGAGIWVIEGLDLSLVAPGRYELLCLPLRLAGGEGAPARALVRSRRDDDNEA